MTEAFALFATHPVAVVACLLAMAMWATVVWVGRGMMTRLDKVCNALEAIPLAIEKDGDETRGRIHRQNEGTVSWRQKVATFMGTVTAKLNGKAGA